MAEYAREEVKYRLATLNNEVGEMALTYIHELEQTNSRLQGKNKQTEKEISELKEQNIKDCESFNKKMKEIKKQWNKEHYWLIKAKELLKDFLLVAKVEHLKGRYETVDEVEQFLGEVE